MLTKSKLQKLCKKSKIVEIKKGGAYQPFCGAAGSRTLVQTYSSKAFYMLISLLFVGDVPEMNKPIHHLAEYS